MPQFSFGVKCGQNPEVPVWSAKFGLVSCGIFRRRSDRLLFQHFFAFFLLAYWLFSKFSMCRIKHTYILDHPCQLAELISENSRLGKPHGEVVRFMIDPSPTTWWGSFELSIYSTYKMNILSIIASPVKVVMFSPPCDAFSTWICHVLFPSANTQVAEERLEDRWVPLDEIVDRDQLEEMNRSI
jgi:hypothetical protein